MTLTTEDKKELCRNLYWAANDFETKFSNFCSRFSNCRYCPLTNEECLKIKQSFGNASGVIYTKFHKYVEEKHLKDKKESGGT